MSYFFLLVIDFGLDLTRKTQSPAITTATTPVANAKASMYTLSEPSGRIDAPNRNNNMAKISTATMAPIYEDTLEIPPLNLNLAVKYSVGAKTTRAKIAMKNTSEDSGVNCINKTPKR